MEKRYLLIFLIFLFSPLVSAMQPICNESQLLRSSSFAIVGKVLNEDCRNPYRIHTTYYKNCSYEIKVLKNLKGDYNAGEVIILQAEVFYKKISFVESAGPTNFGIMRLKIGEIVVFYERPNHLLGEGGGLGGMDCPNYFKYILLEDLDSIKVFNQSDYLGEEVCGNRICEGGESNRKVGCGPNPLLSCLEKPFTNRGTCPEDCEGKFEIICPQKYMPPCSKEEIIEEGIDGEGCKIYKCIRKLSNGKNVSIMIEPGKVYEILLEELGDSSFSKYDLIGMKETDLNNEIRMIYESRVKTRGLFLGLIKIILIGQVDVETEEVIRMKIRGFSLF